MQWSALNPVSTLYALGRLKGVGLLVGVIACSGMAQFVLYTSWVLHGSFKFGWGPQQNGWSLAAVGVTGAIVQGVLLARLGTARGASVGPVLRDAVVGKSVVLLVGGLIAGAVLGPAGLHVGEQGAGGARWRDVPAGGARGGCAGLGGDRRAAGGGGRRVLRRHQLPGPESRAGVHRGLE